MAQAPIVLSSGSVARIPIKASRDFSVRIVEFASGDEQRFRDRSFPKRRYKLNTDIMKGSERADWVNLYEDRSGAWQSFTFLSPIDNLLVRSEAFENSSWVKSNLSAAVDTGADPFGIASSRVRRLTISPTPAALTQSLSINAAGSGPSRGKGLPFTLSWWFKNTGASPSFNLNIDDNGAVDRFLVNVVPVATWTRFSVSGQFSNTNPATTVRAFLDSFSGTGTVDAFGAQLQTGLTMTDYMGVTAGRSGLMTARFANKPLEEETNRPDIFDLDFEIEEILSGT